MHIDIVKTSQTNGHVHFTYKLGTVSPEYNITLPFNIQEDGFLSFRMTEETLRDLIKLLQSYKHFKNESLH